MTEFHVEVVRIGKVEKHPNADSLSITKVHDGYPVIFKTGEFKEDELAVYIPVDAVVPDTPEWAWLAPAGAALREKDRRIKAKRLRGIFSMGLLTKAPPGAKLGQDVAEQLGITKWDPDVDHRTPHQKPKAVEPWYVRLWQYFFGSKDPTRPVQAPKLKYLPGVYDIEPYRKYGKSWFNPGELLVVTEKIHGQNASFVHDGKKLHIKSRTRWRRNDPNEEGNTWAQVAQRYGLEEKLAQFPGIILFGETYGNNADMRYGVDKSKEGDRFIAFDAFDSNTGKWLSHYQFHDLCNKLNILTAPTLRYVTWSAGTFEQLFALAEGPTTLNDKHTREGFVIKPVHERQINGGQRVILKLAGEGYLTRKAA